MEAGGNISCKSEFRSCPIFDGSGSDPSQIKQIWLRSLVNCKAKTMNTQQVFFQPKKNIKTIMIKIFFLINYNFYFIRPSLQWGRSRSRNFVIFRLRLQPKRPAPKLCCKYSSVLERSIGQQFHYASKGKKINAVALYSLLIYLPVSE